jgi:sugar lactone lactonase YvrE
MTTKTVLGVRRWTRRARRRRLKGDGTPGATELFDVSVMSKLGMTTADGICCDARGMLFSWE